MQSRVVVENDCGHVGESECADSPSLLRIVRSSSVGLPHSHRNTTWSLTAMATLQSIPRFLLPRGPLLLRSQPRALPPLSSTVSRCHASASSKGLSEEFRRRQAAQQSKLPPVIPQPDKYRPPSHSARKPNRNLENKIYGAPISEEDKKRMATKKYPNMMSPEGTFSHWFLNNRSIHLWITMVLLLPPHPIPEPRLTPESGHPRLPRRHSMVPRLHLQDCLRPPTPQSQRLPPPPLRI
jgi:hypothetical protein